MAIVRMAWASKLRLKKLEIRRHSCLRILPTRLICIVLSQTGRPKLSAKPFVTATYYLYFPFLIYEVKCSAAALDVVDRQNAYSMTLAMRASVELFRLVKREKSWIERS